MCFCLSSMFPGCSSVQNNGRPPTSTPPPCLEALQLLSWLHLPLCFLDGDNESLTKLITEWEQVLALCQAIITSNSKQLPDINIYQLKVLDCAMDACINLGMLEEALFYAMRTMEPYR